MDEMRTSPGVINLLVLNCGMLRLVLSCCCRLGCLLLLKAVLLALLTKVQRLGVALVKCLLGHQIIHSYWINVNSSCIR